MLPRPAACADDRPFEVGVAVGIQGVWQWPSVNGRVAILKEYSDIPGHVNLGVRDQFANECLFWEVETLPQVCFLRNVPLRNVYRHTNSCMLELPPPRPRWKTAPNNNGAPPVRAVSGKKRPAKEASLPVPAMRRQKSFANAQEAEAVRQDEMVEAFSEAARVGSE